MRTNRLSRRPLGLIGAATAVLLSMQAGIAVAESPGAPADAAATSSATSQIVVLNGTPAGGAQSFAERLGIQPQQVFSNLLSGFSAPLTSEQVEQLKANPEVKSVEPDGDLQLRQSDVMDPEFDANIASKQAIADPAAQATTTGVSWGLDRIDQRQLPLDGRYTVLRGGRRVHAYIVDSGLDRAVAQREFAEYTMVGIGGLPAYDDLGHGTAVANLLAGRTYGVAWNTTVHSVRILDSNNHATDSAILAGLEWVASHLEKPAVLNASIVSPAGSKPNAAISEAMTALITQGVTVVRAAGNDGGPGDSGPSTCFGDVDPWFLTADGITVGATDDQDRRAQFPAGGWSQSGPCVDVSAPGLHVPTYFNGSIQWTFSGTSAATPLVAGAAALYLQTHPNASPSAVESAIKRQATDGVVTGLYADSPNRLLFVR